MNHKYKLMLQGILEITYLDMIDYSDALQNELMRCSHPYSVSAIAACLANASVDSKLPSSTSFWIYSCSLSESSISMGLILNTFINYIREL